MSRKKYLHKKLIEKQSEDELWRKCLKSRRKSRIWTQEELDYSARRADNFLVLFTEEEKKGNL